MCGPTRPVGPGRRTPTLALAHQLQLVWEHRCWCVSWSGREPRRPRHRRTPTLASAHQLLLEAGVAVEGVVLGSSRMSDSAIRMIAKQKPLVLLNRQITETSCIVGDNPRGVRRAVEHLASLGHTTITYVAGPAASCAEG